MAAKNLFRRKLPDTVFTELEEPIRAEIFGVARLEDHAESLARAQNLTDNPRAGRDLTQRLRENQAVLDLAYHILLEAVEEKRAITSAAEWFIDNYHVVQAQVKGVHDHLPPAYYRALPKLAEGHLAGYPQVYGIAWAFVAHTDSRLDPELLQTFLAAYQRVRPLTIGELWAIPITLRLVLIENLRRLAARIVGGQQARLRSDQIADSLLGVGEVQQRSVEDVIESLGSQPIIRSFAVQLLQRLRFQEVRGGTLFQYIDQRLAQDGHTIEQWAADEHTAQSMANVTVRNIITSARLLSAYDWTDFFEQSSLVDKILREGSDFASMDFETRDRYRHRIEELARGSCFTEIEIANRLIARTRQEPAVCQPGYFLLGDGRFAFEDAIGCCPGPRTSFVRWYKRFGIFLYLCSLFLFTLFFALFVLSLTFTDPSVTFSRIALAFLVLIVASEVATCIVNRWTVALLGPRYLPRLDFEEGIPEHLKSFIVVPTMLTDAKKIKGQLEQIEIHYLSNQDDNVYLALLTDFGDAQSEHAAEDEDLLQTAVSELQQLNSRYPAQPGEHPRFSIYHRRRVYSAQEGCWMGWERKRGKLHEFNRLLLGDTGTTYQGLSGEPPVTASGIRYAITLDADTMLPRGTVSQLVGAMAHPLNHPTCDPVTGVVVSGYGILQPCITPSLPGTYESTLFRKLSTTRSGIDPYAATVSDVYQDLFGEGSYTGKGIYDVAAFERALKGRIPENSVLSHDLLEGNFARCGFLSDVKFFEDFPNHTEVAAMRDHRWIRGDWQLLPWIFGHRGHSISPIGRWKMIDNLRRSLVAPASVTVFFLSFLLHGLDAWPIFSLLLLSFIAPALLSFTSDLWHKRPNTPFLQHLTSALREFGAGLAQAGTSILFLPHSAWNSADAIVRALYRMMISRKKLLEWTTAAQAKASASLDFGRFIERMRGSLGITAVGATLLAAYEPAAFLATLPLSMLWIAAPLFARRFSQPPKVRRLQPVKPEDIALYHFTARRIWRFFSTFVTSSENFLPPDNFQEAPAAVVARRSSPTNFSLYLLSVLGARDFGWIGTIEAVDRILATLKSIMGLERHEGHLLNWYDTATAKPLEPRYISSVDNGNFAGHLIALAEGLEEILKARIDASGLQRGVFDTVSLLRQELNAYKAKHGDHDPAFADVSAAYSNLVKQLALSAHSIEDRSAHLANLCDQSSLLVKHAREFAGDPIQPEKEEVRAWCEALDHDVCSFGADYHALCSWRDFEAQEVSDPPGPVDRARWEQLRRMLGDPVPLQDLALYCSKLSREFTGWEQRQTAVARELQEFVDSLAHSLEQTAGQAELLVEKIREAQSMCRHLFDEMEFGVLYDRHRKLFSTGMRVSENQLDASYYDLLASEARLTSFIAIAKGDVPVAHWFHLGRSLVNSGQGPTLVSWSGSMFEYLMPCIVMHSPEGSLLEQTCRNAITRQIKYGTEKRLPWGFSESAYNRRDLDFTYQYSNFGVPDLGLKRGLGLDLVVSPYSTILAALFEPALAAENLRRLQEHGAGGRYGFYEAIDFTASRLPSGHTSSVVKTYMAHHQGMSLVALANLFKSSAMRRRFHADPMVQATELLLHERTPQLVGTLPTPETTIQVAVVKEPVEHLSRRFHTVNRPVPITHLLSNGRYTVMLTSAGSGFSRKGDMAVTRWREDVTRDHYGYYIYLKDCASKDVWSAGYQPVCSEASHYEVSFAEDRARFTRQDFEISSELEIFVSPEEDAEIRRLTLTNSGSSVRHIEVTSYLEVVLNTQSADAAHPAFSNLFVETELHANLPALIASRRPRSKDDTRPWMMHLLRGDSHVTGPIQHETDRSRFIGRGRGVMNPVAIFQDGELSGTVGPVLDPILSLRARVRLEPGTTTHLTFSSGVAEDREGIEIMVDKFHDPATFDRASNLAWTQGQVKLHYLGIEPDEATLFQTLTSRLLYSDPSLRPASEHLQKNLRDITGLWAFGISGDHPIILVRIDDIEGRALIRQLLKAQVFFATKGFVCDLIILNEKTASYSQELQTMLEQMAEAAHTPSEVALTRGKVFLLRSELISEADRVLLATEARVVLSTRHGSLSEQVKRAFMLPLPVPRKRLPHSGASLPVAIPPLEFFNGYGGFSKIHDEYTIVLRGEETTPAPWINVVANADLGFQVSESGSSYTWSLNSRENQLTPWSNDPVCDPSGEALYITDLDSGAVWCPTAAPIRVPEAIYLSHHGHGYSHFETGAFGLYSELMLFVVADAPVKVFRLSLENRSNRIRSIAVTSFLEWVLGFSRATMAPTTITEFDAESQAVFAWNARSAEFGKRITFHAVLGDLASYTCDRTEFIGRNADLSRPAALLTGLALKGRTGGGLDPSSAIQTHLQLKAGQTGEVTFVLGQTTDRTAARGLVDLLRQADVESLLQDVKGMWEELLGRIQVETPDRRFDLMINSWHLYQTIACRLWARASFYQAGGAYGFRDQLQDVMALTMSTPGLAREQILRAAGRQFVEGDVQHWWHPPLGRGVRTRFSDDLLWLPYVVSHYVRVTGDTAILDKEVPFLEGPMLDPGQEDSYFTPEVSAQKASLYEHCGRALDRSLQTGAHGLPLMGSGDWNDGMNRVGIAGRGESVWLAWFLIPNLQEFASIATQRGEVDRAATWSKHARSVIAAVERHGWDGAWYRRAYYDDGTPLGSAQNSECKIDSLAQSWAVISGAAKPKRARQAMSSVFEHLVKPGHEMILLFEPPFDKTLHDPGYIKGYLPGVRENGGQYTHAAAWVVIATALLRDGEKAFELFSFLNPIHHAEDRADAQRYQLEPYVVPGDVYSQSPHVGRGGWSWYTGSAGWIYRAGVEYILGLQVRGNELTLKPCVPPSWQRFRIRYLYGRSLYTIHVEIEDHKALKAEKVVLVDDGEQHEIRYPSPLVRSSTPGRARSRGSGIGKGVHDEA